MLRHCYVQGSFEFSWRTQRLFFRASSGSSQRPNFNAKVTASQPSNKLSARFQDPTHLVICPVLPTQSGCLSSWQDKHAEFALWRIDAEQL